MIGQAIPYVSLAHVNGGCIGTAVPYYVYAYWVQVTIPQRGNGDHTEIQPLEEGRIVECLGVLAHSFPERGERCVDPAKTKHYEAEDQQVSVEPNILHKVDDDPFSLPKPVS